MAKNAEPILVTVHVNSALWEYLIGVNGGSDVMAPDYQGELWVFVKSRLQTVPSDYRPETPEIKKGIIRIALPPQRGASAIYNLQLKREIFTNFIYRNYLDEEAQRQVEGFLMKGFKKTFRDFMAGAVSCNTQQAIKDAIEKFCEVYRIEMDSISYEMLRKDWYRFRNRDSRGDPCTEVKENF